MVKLLIFEGISGSGKTTLFHPVHKLSNYKDLQIHRFTPTNWVYDRINNRREVDYEELNQSLQSIISTYIIWCRCSPEEALTRQIYKNDPMIEDLEKANQLFTEYFSTVSTWKNVIQIPTDRLTIEESVGLIKQRIYDPISTP